MRYDKHNFVQNFSNATTMGDHEAAKSMLLSQVADIIMMHSDLVISDLKQIGIDVPKNPSSNQLAKLSIDNIDNPIFMKLLAETIIHHQEVYGLSASGEFDGIVSLGGEDLNYNASGEEEVFFNAIDPISAVAEAAGELFKFGSKFAGKKGEKQIAQSQIDAEKERSKQELIKLLNTKQAGKNEKNIKHVMSPFAILGIVLGGIVVLGAIGYGIYRIKNKKATT